MNDATSHSVTNSYTDGDGGMFNLDHSGELEAYFDCLDISTVYAQGYGGFLYTNTDNDIDIQFTDTCGTAEVDTVYAVDGDGGFIYGPSSTQTLTFVVEDMDFTDVYCDDGSNYDCTGGVAYFGAHQGTSTITLKNSDFTNCYSTSQGSIIHTTGSNSFNVDMDVDNCEFAGGTEVPDGLMYGDWEYYGGITSDLENVKQGGAFYFGTSGTSSTIDITNDCRFYYFLQTGEGSVWRIPSGMTVTDTSS
jgi:hypothetical protein